MAASATAVRDKRGKFARKNTTESDKRSKYFQNIIVEHNYCTGNHKCDGPECRNLSCKCKRTDIPKHIDKDGWRVGRRVIELSILLSNLKACSQCLLGPVPLTEFNIVGEVRKGLGGYLYVRCENCGNINRAPYGKTRHRQGHGVGMPCFDVNTKLGTAMIDNIGGPRRVNNFLTTLNVPAVSNTNLKSMERRAGASVETVSDRSSLEAASQAYQQEMKDIAECESKQAAADIECLDDDLGVGLMVDSSPTVRNILQSICTTTTTAEEDWTDIESTETTEHNQSPLKEPDLAQRKHQVHMTHRTLPKARKCLGKNFPCKTRYGMACAMDTAWQKRGFDSLTSHTFFMSKAKYGKKVVKTVVKHRTCGTCKWWRRNRPGVKVKPHRCVANHRGSARMMESVSGEQGLDELSNTRTPIEIIEGDGDSTLMARVRDKYPHLKKRYDKNHVVKNIGKSLYSLQSSRKTKLSKSVVQHIQKCLKYCLAKNQGDKAGLEENLRAIIPHQFGDHSLCHERFCGEKRTTGQKYCHQSLPHKTALKDDGSLRSQLEAIFAPVAANAEAYADMGSSQQCEHANREVTLRAPKSHHYGESESLDFRVKATAACINEGRSYICQDHSEAGLSPGMFTKQYADKRMQERRRKLQTSSLPSTKRRRLTLKQERASNQGLFEVLEGASYQSGVALGPSADTEQIPEAVPRGNFQSISVPPKCEVTVVAMDLETTDLIHGQQMPDITQIAAIDVLNGSIFNTFVIPKKPISFGAQQTTGIVYSGDVMTVRGTAVEALVIEPALEKFCSWLEQFNYVVLMAHNGRNFDFPILVCAFAKNKILDKLCACVTGCVDSIHFFKKVFPKQPLYKQEELVKNILHTSYNAHDALADVSALKDLYISCTTVTVKDFLQLSFSLKAVHKNQIYLKEKAQNLPSLSTLVAHGVCKMATAENIAGSGLNLNHLRLIFSRDGQDGLLNVFKGINVDAKPRVSNNKRVLETVIPKLAEYLSDN